jgi:tetratricopeptide (TPR) repeat protein
VLGIAAQLAAVHGDYATARELCDEGLPLVRETGARWHEARYLDALALLAIEQGDFDEAAKWLTGSLDVSRAMGDTWGEAAALNKLGDVARGLNDHARARRLYEESLARIEGRGDELRASILHNLGYVSITEGDHHRAAALLAQSLRLGQARGDQRGMAECLVGFACLASATGQRTRAARLFGAAAAALESLRAELSPSNRIDQERALDMARIGHEDAFTAAYAAGRALSLDEAIHEAITAAADETSSQPHGVPPVPRG